MSTIYFNDKLRRNLNQALFTRTYNQYESYEYGLVNWVAWGGGVSPVVAEYGVIQLMKGSVPTDFTGLTSITSRSTDILVTWTTSQAGFTYNNPVTSVDGIATISSGYSIASASGVATWFWWYVNDSYDRILMQLAGTVGTSNADLIMGDTTIIAGANYRFQNLKFDVPTTYTY